MKTDKKNIVNELEELNASFLLNLKKDEVKQEVNFDKTNTQIINHIDKPTRSIRKIVFAMSALAACFIVGLFVFNTIDLDTNNADSLWSDVSEDDILFYIEDELSYYSEEEILAYLEIEESTNLFDNSGISDNDLEEYFINELNEETQLEELL